MIANIAGADGIIVLIIALVVLVGGSQLPKIARNIGLAGKEFRKAQSEAEEEQAKAKAAAAASASVPPPVALPATPPAGAASSAPVASPAVTAGPAPAAAAPAGDDSITLTPAQLEALLKAREEQARQQSGPASN